MTEDEIGASVRMAMARADINATELAEAMGKTRQTTAGYTKGKNKNIDVLSEIASICGMEYQEMMDLGKVHDEDQ